MEHFMVDLKITQANLTAETVNYTRQSDGAMGNIDATGENFKQIPTPNEVNIFVVKDVMQSVLWQYQLQFLMEEEWLCKRSTFFSIVGSPV